jgi:lipooligosaccharide transport system permease protein
VFSVSQAQMILAVAPAALRLRPVPGLVKRLAAVWMRHYMVYTNDFWTNAFPTVIEPLIFILAVGWGLAAAVGPMQGFDYLTFIAPAQIMISAVFTSAFETSYGTYFRLEVDRHYDSMVATPVGPSEVFWGELLFTGTKGVFYSAVMLVVLSFFHTIHSTWALLVPLVGFFTAITFGSLGFFANRLVKNINQFNFFISGFISPLILFSGTLFPLDKLPQAIQAVAYVLPLYHFVHLSRMLTTGVFYPDLPVSLAYMLTVPWILGAFSVKVIQKKLIK